MGELWLMTDDIFESADTIIAMVKDAKVEIPEAKIRQLYSLMEKALKECRTDEWYLEKFANDWRIELKKSACQYRSFADIMTDISALWLKADSATRDDICKMFIGVSDDNKHFFNMMDCCHADLYQVVIPDNDKNSIYSSVDALKSALDGAIDNEKFRPPRESVSTVYKYIALAYNQINNNDADLKCQVADLGIDTSAGFCKMFDDVVRCYCNGDWKRQMELQRMFWRGIPWDALVFRNVFDRIEKYIYRKNTNESGQSGCMEV